MTDVTAQLSSGRTTFDAVAGVFNLAPVALWLDYSELKGLFDVWRRAGVTRCAIT